MAVVNGSEGNDSRIATKSHLSICESEREPRVMFSVNRFYKCFKLIHNNVLHDCQRNWFDALVDCRKKGMRLASIDSEDERQHLVTKLNSSKGMLIIVHFYCRRNFRELVHYS